jgi:HSP20 family protein
MKLTKLPPAPVTLLREEVDNLFDRILGTNVFAHPGRTLETMWTPALDFSETDKEYIVRVEAPGIPKDDLEVNLDGQSLTVSGRREIDREEKSEEYFWRERETGKFVRNLKLPAAVNNAKVVAAYHDGVMTIRLPKLEPAAKTRVAIA